MRLPVFALAVLALAFQADAHAATIFWEGFDGYTHFPDENPQNDPINWGIPEISEGADEFWYAGRFEYFDGGTIDQDLAVQEFGGSDNPTPVGRMEDEAGLLFFIEAGFTDVTLTFDWRTFSTATEDRLVVGYHVGDDLGFDQGANRFRDFFNDDFDGNHNDAVAWWEDEWVEILRGRGGTFETVSVSLPDHEDIWVAFWLDNGEGDFGKIDNIHVQGTVSPEPTTISLVLVGLLGLAASRRHPRQSPKAGRQSRAAPRARSTRAAPTQEPSPIAT